METVAAGMPLYEKVRLELRELVRSEYRPGDLLPTQTEIVHRTGASAITVKRALQELAREGLIESTRGKGTIVRRFEVADLHAGVSSWSESVSGFGEMPQTAWTKIERRTPPERVRNLLKIAPSAETFRIRRLRMVRGKPICLMINEIPAALIPEFNRHMLDCESLYDCLHRHFRLHPARADEDVTARESAANERKHLGAQAKVVLVVTRRTFLANRRPLELATVVANAASYRYQVELFNQPNR